MNLDDVGAILKRLLVPVCVGAAAISLLADSPAPAADRAQKTAAPTALKAAQALKLADDVDALLVRIAPYKQYDLKSDRPNAAIGRTPGSACEVMRFLLDYSAVKPGAAATNAKITELAAWVVSVQDSNRKHASYGGAPSTPDLKTPQNAYYYTIDSAFCAEAMAALFKRTNDPAHLRSAIAFADHLVAMQAGPKNWARRRASAGSGFCEFVVVTGSGPPLWNCDSYVKTLIALGPLKEVAALSGDQAYRETALQARAALYPGLAGAWEYAEAPKGCCAKKSAAPAWRRVNGPHGEKNYFVYGDTLAYALKGLYQFDDDPAAVTALYQDFTSYRGAGPRTAQYDGRIAYAGYLIPQTRSADELSAYYDLATLGILYEVRDRLNPDDAAVSADALLKYIGEASSAAWYLRMDFTKPSTTNIDTTTLANLGEAALRIYNDNAH